MTDSREAAAQLRLVDDMVAQFGRTVGSIWKYLYAVGVLGIAACAVSQVLLVRGRDADIPLVWFIEVIVASAVMLFLRRREVRQHRIVTPIDRASIAVAAAYAISTLVIGVLLLFGVRVWIALSFLLAGLSIFVCGVITGWRECFASAAVWWVGGVFGLARPLESFLLMIGLLLLGTLLPARLLERRLRHLASPSDPPHKPVSAVRAGGLPPDLDPRGLQPRLAESRTSSGNFWQCLAVIGAVGSAVELVVHFLAATGRLDDALLSRAMFCAFSLSVVLLLGGDVLISCKASTEGHAFTAKVAFGTWLAVSLTGVILSLASWAFWPEIAGGLFAIAPATGAFIIARVLFSRPFYVAAALLWVGGAWLSLRPESQLFVGPGLMLGGLLLPAVTLRTAEATA